MKEMYLNLVKNTQILFISAILLTSLLAKATTCPNATIISGSITFPSSAITLSCGTTDDITGLGGSGGTACGDPLFMQGNEALFVYTPNAHIAGFTVSYTGVSWTSITIFQGCPTSGGTCLTSIANADTSKTTTGITLAAGITYYIMIDTWPSPASPCPGTIQLYGTILAICSGVPNAGTALTSESKGCVGSVGNLFATGLTIAAGLNYQWQKATAAVGPWSNITGAIATTHSFTPTIGTTYFRLVTTCSVSALSNTSSPVSYTGLNCTSINVPSIGSNTINCGANTRLFDDGGATGNYSDDNDGYTVLNNAGSGIITISGRYLNIETGNDSLSIYSGAGVTGTLLYSYSGSGTITTFNSTPGQVLTVQLFSDSSINDEGFDLNVIYTNYVAITPTITIAGKPAICAGEVTNLAANGATSYTWTGLGSSNPLSISPSATTIYSVTGSACGLNSSPVTYTVTVNANPTVSALASNTLICSGNSVVLTASTSATSYTWNTSATTMSISVSPTLTTTYTVNVTNASTCSSSALITVNVNTCTGIEELLSNAVSIYPNPNNGLIHISLSSELSKHSRLEIYDAIGKLIVTETLSNEINTIDIANLSNGIYYFRIWNTNSLVKIGKLVKQ